MNNGSLFPSVARFTTRRSGESDESDLLLGLTIKGGQSLLKPDTIYEIKDILGVLTIVEIGPMAHPTSWSRDVNSILRESGGRERRVFLTLEEMAREAKENEK